MRKQMKIPRLLVCLLVVFASLIAARQGQAAPAENRTVETATTFPVPGMTENLCETADGSFYVTSIVDRLVWKVTPNRMVQTFFEAPSATAFIGIATSGDELVVGVFQKPFSRPAPPGAPAGGFGLLDFSDVGSRIYVLDRAGKVKATIDGQKGQAFNGIAPLGHRRYLIADTNAASILLLDTSARRIETWLKDDQLAPTGSPPIGANGIKVNDGWVYVSNSSNGTLYRVQIGTDGKPKGGLMVLAKMQVDDFAVTRDGTLFVPSGDRMLKVSPSGEVSTFLEKIPQGPAALIGRDGKWLYWPTRERGMSARLVRVAIN